MNRENNQKEIEKLNSENYKKLKIIKNKCKRIKKIKIKCMRKVKKELEELT